MGWYFADRYGDPGQVFVDALGVHLVATCEDGSAEHTYTPTQARLLAVALLDAAAEALAV